MNESIFAVAIREHFRQIDRRDAMLGARLIGEPGWNILLDLAAARMNGKRISVTSACLASRAPMTTALRYIVLLEHAGLIARQADELDHRRFFLSISDTAFAEAQGVLCPAPTLSEAA